MDFLWTSCGFVELLRTWQRSQIVAETFPKFQMESSYLQFVTKLKYQLGHIITRNLSDDDDIQREIRNLFVRTNVLRSRFNKCSTAVNVFYSDHTVSVYSLWRCTLAKSYHGINTQTDFMRYYFKCIKLFVGYKRTDSVTNMLFALNLPSFNTILHNSSVVFKLQRYNVCNAAVVRHLNLYCST